MKRKLFVIALMLLASGTLLAQGVFSIHFGGAFPMGGFGASDMDKGKCTLFNNVADYGGADVGFDLGVKAIVPILPVEGLSMIFNVEFMLNGLNDDVKDYFDDLRDFYEDIYGSCDDITMSKYINIPVMLGLNYAYAVSPTFKLYGEASLGVNERAITKTKVVIGDSDGTKYESSYDVATTFAYQAGVGFVVNDKFSIGLHYYGLGAHKVEGKSTTSGTAHYSIGDMPTYEHADIKSKDIAPTILLLQLGFSL